MKTISFSELEMGQRFRFVPRFPNGYRKYPYRKTSPQGYVWIGETKRKRLYGNEIYLPVVGYKGRSEI